MKLGKVLWIGWIKYYYDKNSNPQSPGFACSDSHHEHRNHTWQLHQPWQWLRPALYPWFLGATQEQIAELHNTGGHRYEAKVRLLDDWENGLKIMELAYMDHTMGMVIILLRVKTKPL